MNKWRFFRIKLITIAIATILLTIGSKISWAQQPSSSFSTPWALTDRSRRDWQLEELSEEISYSEEILSESNPTLLAQGKEPKNSSLPQQARQLYQQGKFTEAINLLQIVIDRYQTEGNVGRQAIATRNLALIYQQLGKWEQAKQALEQTDQLIAQLTNKQERQLIQAQVLEVQGQLELSLAKPEQALDTWKQASSIYQQTGDLTGFTRSKIYQAQALQALGLYSQTIKTLNTVTSQLRSQPDNIIKVKALNNLGNVFRRVGQYEKSQSILEESLDIATKLQFNPEKADILLNLGNLARLEQEPTQALFFYQQAFDLSPHSDIKLQGKLNQLSLLIAEAESEKINQLIPQIENFLAQLPTSKTKIEGQINLAHSLLKLKEQIQPTRISNLLVTAIKLAQNLGMARAETEATGTLGALYEQQQRFDEALILTKKALLIAQTINAPELAYQWQWQLGRILKAQRKREESITAYTQAVEILQSLRGDLVAISSDLQFSFGEQIEPVYRQLATLLLHPQATQADLEQARQIIESLQLAELDNFFRDACLDAQPVQIDQLDPKAAIIYTIILEDRLEVIAAIPKQPLRRYTTKLSKSEIEISFISGQSLISRARRRLSLEPLKQAYDWLIRPIEAELAANSIETLVFIPDGVLRNLPPATFHDGNQYLVEKYNLAIAPSLQLIDSQPLAQVNQESLLAGLSQPRQGFTALPGVKQEITQIQQQYTADVLLDESFTEANFTSFASKLPYNIIHLATHGRFSSQAKDTFVLTWDERLSIDELNTLIRGDRKQARPIELLVLSACETAAGDRQAVLGLAGMSVRAGTRSTIASLWAVSDKATIFLMTRFYEELYQGNITKAEALRNAQQALIKEDKFAHPYFWSAFILLGNWL